MEKINLQDVSFLLPVRIDSIIRMENTLMVIDYLQSNFLTSIVVLNADDYDNEILKKELASFASIKYIFIEDHDNVFYRTKYINYMVSLVSTAYVAIWDVDVIIPIMQIIDSIEHLRNGCDVVYPYKTFLDTSRIIRELYFKTRDCSTLINNSSNMKMIYGPNMKGGAFLINRFSYIDAGMENEDFYGWGPEDWERYERWIRLQYNIYICDGYLFHLTHPRGINSAYRSSNQNKCTRQIYNKTLSASKEEIILNIRRNKTNSIQNDSIYIQDKEKDNI